jgi:integrase
MRALITSERVRRLPAGPVDIRDTKLPAFVVRVRPNGRASYLVSLARGVWHTIGPVGVLSPHEAREEARGLLGDVAKDRSNGRDPIAERKKRRAAARPTLLFKTFLVEHYEPWKLEQHKRGAETVRRLKTVFADFADWKLTEITAWHFEKWRTDRLKAALGKKKKPKPDTVNSHLTMLKAALQRAVDWKLLPIHPLADVKPIKTDKTGRVRYLTPDEDQRLRAALAARDATRQARREQANRWRKERGYPAYPIDARDPLTTVVLVALNTGMRKSEILQLRGGDVDLPRAQLTVRGRGAKSAQTRYLPLNAEALAALRAWPTATDPTGYVFPGRKAGTRLLDLKGAWARVAKAAKLVNFTFHDLRHDFASQLVMKGEDLNTVRELLGHADIKMTLRYAHLAPAHKAAAVAKLGRV